MVLQKQIRFRREQDECVPSRSAAIPVAWCPCLSSSKHQAAVCMETVWLDLIKLYGRVFGGNVPYHTFAVLF